MTAKRQLAGDYIDEMVDTFIASSITNLPCIVIGAPGWGKTTVIKSLARQIYGERGKDWFFKQINPTTPPAALEGATDVPALLEESKYQLNQIGTPFDPDIMLVSLDELFRGEDFLFDLAMGILKREDLTPDQQPCVWMTSNFIQQDERTEAMRDRIAYWRWLRVNNVSLQDVMDAQDEQIGGDAEVTTPLPSLQEINDIRALKYGGQSTPKAKKAVDEIAHSLVNEMTQGVEYGGNTYTWDWHPRPVRYWRETMYRMTTFYTGVHDFEKVDEKALKLLSAARVLTTYDEAMAWRQVVESIADPIALAIEEKYNQAYRIFKDEFEKTERGEAPRNELVTKLGMPLQNAMDDLEAIGADDPRVVEATGQLKRIYFAIVGGDNPFNGG
jgi:hypothetical protein